MNTENLSTLKIHKLTQAQYDRELVAGNIDESALYLTPEEEIDLSPYATIEQVNTKADASHSHAVADITNLQSSLDEKQVTITGAASTITTDDLPLNRVVVSDNFGKVSVSAITTAELNYLNDATSNIQSQLDNKASSSDVANLQSSLNGKSDTSHTHSEYMTETNPVGSGSFSINRKSGSTVGDYSSTFGYSTTASGSCSHAEGCYTEATESYSHAEGYYTDANGEASHAEGDSTWASGTRSHAEGYDTTASGEASHAEGYKTTASSTATHAEGFGATASGIYSHAEGTDTIASGQSSHAEGCYTEALSYQHAQGHYNNTTNAKVGVNSGTSSGTAFVIGNGTSSAGSNAFRVTYEGKPYAKSNFATTGCDYAEFFEWQDLNPNSEDRRGYFVTLDEDKIKIAEPNDYILGIISGQPSIVGNGDEDWLGRYVFDEFGAYVYEDFEYEVDEFDKETGEKITVTKTGKKYKENPDYDPTIPYIQREDRPEWDAVGMLGVLSVRDDGTCKVNGYCTVAEGGIATASEIGYRVIKRVNDNIVKVVFR